MRFTWLVVVLSAFVFSACGPATGGSPVDSSTSNGDGQSGDGGSIDGETMTGDGALPCPTSCSLGAKSCDGNGVRTCEQSGACTMWSTAVACATGVCSGGQCVSTCTSQCTLGATYCSADGYRSCIQTASGCNDWSPGVTSCTGGQVCSGGACSATCADRCASGAKQCSGSGVQTCERKASGCLDWSDPIPCAGGNVCSGGMCQASCTNQCAANDKRCMGGDQIQLCEMQASGCLDWSPAQLCPGGGTCAANMCVSCTSGAKRCAGTTVEECMAGSWTPISSCPFGCMTGMCQTTVSCTAGSYRCNGNTVEICNSSGTAYLATATCANSCNAGLCTGACTPDSRRCNGMNLETCNTGGTAWAVSETCTTFCDAQSPQCGRPALDVTANTTNLDGEVVFSGPVVIRVNATLRSPTGNLTIRAPSITVEQGGTIVVDPTGDTAAGRGGNALDTGSWGYSGGGGGYGTAGERGTYGAAGPAFGSNTDAHVLPGSAGGNGNKYSTSTAGNGGKGGGVLRLIAPRIVIAGQITANGDRGGNGTGTYGGGGGGGSGGGVLIAADDLTFTGTISAGGGLPGSAGGGSSSAGATGGLGRVKLLYGATRSLTGTVTGTKTEGLLPPLQITSSTHPDSDLFYNDDFPAVAITWNKAFPAVQGYFVRSNSMENYVPTATAGNDFLTTELFSIDRTRIVQGLNYFHIAPVDATSVVGTVEAKIRIQMNTFTPRLSSSTHTSQTAWNPNDDVFYTWTNPGITSQTSGAAHPDQHFKGYHYILDHYGDTVPTTAATFIPVTQKTLVRSDLAPGIWVFHIVAVDQKGYLTKQAAHYQVRIGPDPGTGTIAGTVTEAGGGTVSGASVTINRSLFGAPQSTNTTAGYNYNTIPFGTWEVTASKAGYVSQTKTITTDTTTMDGTVKFTLTQ